MAEIACIAGDPGGASALLPVVQALAARADVRLRLWPYRQAVELWQRNGLQRDSALAEPATDWPSQSDISNLLAQADLLLTATSVNGVDLEQRAMRAAHEKHIPTLALLDFWRCYRQRFEFHGETLWPDVIAVMDETAAEALRNEGVADERLAVTGQPAFDRLQALRRAFSMEERAALRRKLGWADEEKVILFVSQPLRAFWGGSEPLGFAEDEVLALLAAQLPALRKNGSVRAVVRPHPREDQAAVAAHCAALEVELSTEEDGYRLAMAADCVVGMNSVFLLEACYLGAIVLSVQPGLSVPDDLPCNRNGMSLALYHAEELERVLQRALRDKDFIAAQREKLRECQADGQATQRVLAEVDRLLKKRSGEDGKTGLAGR